MGTKPLPADPTPSSGHDTTLVENLIAGGSAGVVECLIMYPLDVVKTIQQLKFGHSSGTMQILMDLFKRERFGVYRGISAPLLMETPKRAIKFTANNTFKHLFSNGQGQLSQSGAIFAGACAGLTEAFIIVPFELVKIRMQNRDNMALYTNTIDAVVKIIRREGPLTFYNGLESTFWRNGIWNATYFGSIYYTNKNYSADGEWKSGWHLLLRNFSVGCIAGIFATTLNTPFDVVKSRFQNSSSKIPWTWPAILQVWQTEGLRSLWKGYTPKVLRLGPGGGILFLVHQTVSSWLVSRRTHH